MLEIEISVPDGRSGDWEVDTFTVSPEDSAKSRMMASIRGSLRDWVKPGTYRRLSYKNRVIMSNTSAEIKEHSEFIHVARGKILIAGLGLGMALTAILKKPEVEAVVVIEKSEDVIRLVAPTFASDPRVEIIHEDIFEYHPPKGVRYDVAWFDIWESISSDNLPEMAKLHRRYGRRAKWKSSWGFWECQRARRW